MKRNPLRRRILSVQSLESRRLLASLASRLPPIRVSADEPILIADTAGSTYQVSQAALQGLRELEQLLEIDAPVAADNVASLSRLTWQQVEANPQSVQTPAPTLQQATEIVTIGFERVGDDPFGTPLSSRALATTSMGESELNKVIDVGSGLQDSPQIAEELEHVDSPLDALTVVRTTARESEAESEPAMLSELEPTAAETPVTIDLDAARTSRSGQVQDDRVRSESSSDPSTIGPVDIVVHERVARWTIDETSQTTNSGSRCDPAAAVDPVAGMLWLSTDGIDADTLAAGNTGEFAGTIGFDPFAIVQMFLGDSTESDALPHWPTFAVFSSWGGEAEEALTQLSVPQRWSMSTGAAVLVMGYLYYSQVLPQRRETDRRRISLCR